MTRIRISATLDPWLITGAECVELEYLGAGRYWAVKTTVARLTPTQAVTATGRRFWRRGALLMVGYETDRLAGLGARLRRLVPPDNPYAQQFFAGPPTRTSTSPPEARCE